MRIGILGGTGPAGSALAARLASVGYEVVIGSRSKYRALEARDSQVEKWPELAPLLGYGDNAAAAACELIVIATPWDSAATTAQENEEALAGKVVGFIDNAKPNFNHLADDIGDLLMQKYGVKQVIKRRKRAASVPAPEAVYKEYVEQVDLVITGSGD